MVETRQKPKELPTKKDSKLEKFLKFDNCCLKFTAFWDDRDSLSGDIHDLNVYYYLSDDTIQITEIPKHGRPVIFYKRLKLPKVLIQTNILQLKTSTFYCSFLSVLENGRLFNGTSKIKSTVIECARP